MKIEVIYSTRTGNTERIAEAIAGELGTTAKRVSEVGPLDEVDLLFVGRGLYGWNVDPVARKFVHSLNSAMVKRVAVFGTASTYAGNRRVTKQMQQLLRHQDLAVSDETYSCKARMWFFNRGKPDEDHLKRAADLARTAAKEAGPRTRK